jgi:RNA recognition motif-containing protein
MPKKIFIGGLSATATEASLQQLFAPFGEVVSVELLAEPPDATAGSEVQGYGQMPGGTVTFADEAAGERAIAEMNGAALEGGTVTVVPWPA